MKLRFLKKDAVFFDFGREASMRPPRRTYELEGFNPGGLIEPALPHPNP
jgi:hypothetical protein